MSLAAGRQQFRKLLYKAYTMQKLFKTQTLKPLGRGLLALLVLGIMGISLGLASLVYVIAIPGMIVLGLAILFMI